MTIKQFFDDNCGQFSSVEYAEEMVILSKIVYRFVIAFFQNNSQIPSLHGRYMTTWLNEHPIVCLSEETVSLLFRFCRGEGLMNIQDMLSRV